MDCNSGNRATDTNGVGGSDLFKNLNNDLNPTSEVGSLQRSLSAGHVISVPDVSRADLLPDAGPCRSTATPPTYSDGSGLANHPVPLQPVVANVPPEFFLHMTTMMQNMSERFLQEQSDKVRITDIFLPSFDPDGSVGVREWCDHISTAVSNYQLSDYDIRMKVSSLLKGRARMWADNWLVTTSTWAELREIIITTFEPENRYSRDILKFREHVYSSNKDIAEFLSQGWLLWKRITRDRLNNDDAVEAVIGMVCDERLRIELMNVRAKTVPELISVASSIRAKRPSQPSANQLPQKRARFSADHRSAPYCNFCHKVGHISQNCRYKSGTVSAQRNAPSATAAVGSTMSPIPSKFCSFCSKPGHTFDTCYRREKQITSNVNMVTSNNPSLNTMRMKVSNIEIDAVFDSGAECSVMRETCARKIPGRRQQVVNYLRGLGPIPVVSTSTLTAICAINNINVEIDFHILPDFEMTTNVLIGANLLRDTGLSVIVTQTNATLIHNARVCHIRSNSPLFDKLDHDLTDQSQINQLLALLNEYSYLFTRGFSKTRVNTGELEIRLKNPDKFVERRPYRLAPIERQKVKDIVSELIENNIIRESKSPYSSPVVLVKKKNGDDRMCVDYRELNSNTIRDHYPLPLIGDQIDQLVDGRYFNCLDMASGFHQIPISAGSIEKTAFVTQDGLYEYITMPFGLCNAPSVYQRCINRALGPLLNPGSASNDSNDSIAQVYIDDVISKCRDFHSGISYLERIFIALRDSGFSINPDKCSFFKKSIEYLGNLVEDGKVHPSPKKVEALLKSPIPTTVKQVRQFNGLAGYFRRFIPDFSRTMAPLYNLTKQGVKWSWTNVHEETRQKVIQYLTSCPVLTIFREGDPVELHTDASSLGFGAVLVQIINGRQHVVAYFSMRTTEVESRYHSYELETLAVVRAIKHFRHYLYGRRFKVITDCNALKASEHKRDLLPRIHRWWAFLQNFNFDIEYRKGERMQHADFFSRNPGPLNVNVLTSNVEWLNVEQRRDSQLRAIIDALENGEDVAGYSIDNFALKYERLDPTLGPRKLIVVPRSFQWSLINTFHLSLKHPGWDKTLAKLRETYFFEKMSTIVREFVENCVVCRTSKQSSGATQVQMHPIPKPTSPFEVIHMDITGKLGTDQEYVIVAIDAFSKYVLLRYSKNKSQHSTLAVLKQLIHLFGAPRQVVVDGGREFLGEYKNYCDSYGIQIHTIAPGVSRANGQVERVMGTLKNGLIIIKNYETAEWHTALESLQLALNCTVHKTTGIAPLTLLTRRQNCVPPELLNLVNFDNQSIDADALEQHVRRRMIEAADKNKARFDRNRAKIHHFQRGDFVLIKNNPRNQTSLDPKYSAPYEIYRVLENDRYLVRKVIGHRGRPRKVAHDQLRRAPQPGGNGDQMTVSPSDDQTPTMTQQLSDDMAPLSMLPATDEQEAGPSGLSQAPAHATNTNDSTSNTLSSTD